MRIKGKHDFTWNMSQSRYGLMLKKDNLSNNDMKRKHKPRCTKHQVKYRLIDFKRWRKEHEQQEKVRLCQPEEGKKY